MARFTVLTDSVIRMEYAKAAGNFEDRKWLDDRLVCTG